MGFGAEAASPYPHPMPHDVSNPSGRSATSEDPLQLNLFSELDRLSLNEQPVPMAVARAAVSPGWWPLVQPLFEEEAGIAVYECREVAGRLALRASMGNESGPQSIEPLLDQFRANVQRTCGCCGASPPTVLPMAVEGTVHRVCNLCRRRLEAGEAYLAVADDHWRFDGTRRRRTVPRDGATESGEPVAPTKRQCTTLPPDELRATIAEIRSVMASRIVGQQEAVDRVALLAGLHVGGGLARGGRALVLGPSGVGKSSLIEALRDALDAGRWDVPVVFADAQNLSSPGWKGAWVGDLIETALAGESPDSGRARHAVVAIDELHHANVGEDMDGNMRAKRDEIMSSLLGLFGHGVLHLGEIGSAWSSRNALVIGLGAFTGTLDLSHVPAPSDLVRAGIPVELGTRFEEVIMLSPLAEAELLALLRRWPALISLVEVCERLGFGVRIHDETYRRAARALVLGADDATARTAGAWLVTALRHELITALTAGEVRDLVITPDSLEIARAAVPRADGDEPWGESARSLT